MKLSKFIKHLNQISTLNFIQPNGNFIPNHFHITQACLTTKNFIDCGGTLRMQKTIDFQIWVANDFEHRLEPQKLLKIIDLAKPLFENADLEVEIEYQMETIGRFGLDFDGMNFILTTKQTDCLAQDKCGIPQEKLKVNLSNPSKINPSSCTPGSGCC